MKCINCGIDFEGRKDAKYCSPNCRVTFSRKASIVTDNVTLSEPTVTDNFKFTINTADNNPDDVKQSKNEVQTAKYWYDVPIAAKPIIKKGNPEMPEYMNGRQYFLWWKNDFRTVKEDEKGETGTPIIHNPFPHYDKLTYVQAGENSRHWGTN